MFFFCSIILLLMGLFFLSYSFLVVLMLLELFMIFFYFCFVTSNFLNGFYPLYFLMVLVCLMVLEAVLGLSLILISYRSFGGGLALLW